MTQEQFQKRFARYADLGKLLFVLIILYWLIQMMITAYFVITGETPPGEAEQSVLNLVFSVLFSAFVIAVMVMVICLLQSIQRGKTPFTADNVRRLRWIGGMLVAFELLQHLVTRLFWAAASGRVENGEQVVYYYNSTAGMVLIVGLAVLGISLVFQYGVELQKLSDETL